MSKRPAAAAKPTKPAKSPIRFKRSPDPHPTMTAFAATPLADEPPVVDHGPESELHPTDAPAIEQDVFLTGITNHPARRALRTDADFAGQPEPEAASSTSFTTPAADATGNPPTTSATQEKPNMEITLKRSTAPRKTNRLVIYNLEGRTGSVQFLSTLFGGNKDSQGNPPETLTLVGEFAEPKVKEPKAKLTPEERKAKLAALPKLTLAQKVEKAEKRMEQLRQKLAAEAAAEAPAAQ